MLYYVQNPISGEVKACASKRSANELIRYGWKRMKDAEVLAYRRALAERQAHKLSKGKDH